MYRKYLPDLLYFVKDNNELYCQKYYKFNSRENRSCLLDIKTTVVRRTVTLAR